MNAQLELPGMRAPHVTDPAVHVALRALDISQWWCTACGFEFAYPGSEHTDAQCIAMRAPCTVDGCERVTCVQARHHGYAPLCLDHFFDGTKR